MSFTPIAYNPSMNPIPGTEQVGELTIGTSDLDYSLSPDDIIWWMGPDESVGYVVAFPVASCDSSTPIGDIGTVKFWRSDLLSDESFISLAQSITGQSFTDAETAKSHLNSSGYWTSWKKI